MMDKELETISKAFDKVCNAADKLYFLGVLDGLTANIGLRKEDKEKEPISAAGQ